MLILRAIEPGDGVISQSPFSMKAMGYLHMLGLEWQLDIKADIRKQPNGKLPVLVDGPDVIADSGAIALHLEAKVGRSLNDGLDDGERMLSHAVRRMAEEHIYFIAVHNRWSEDENFALIRPSLEKLAPFPMLKILPGIIRKSVIKQVNAQGVGRMSDDLRVARLAADFGVLEFQLGEKPFLFGDRATAADLSVVPMLAVLLACPADTRIRRELTGRPKLVEYTNHAVKEAFPALDALPFPPRS